MHTQRKQQQSIPNWKRKQQAAQPSSSNNDKGKQKSVAHFSTLISQPTVSPAIPYEVLICAYLITHLFLQHYNIYSTNFYNYDFFVLSLALSVICLRLLIKFISNHHLSSPFQKVVTTTVTNVSSDDILNDKRTTRRNTEQMMQHQEHYRYRVRWRVLLLHVLVLVLFFTVIYFALHVSLRYGLRYLFFSFAPFFVYILIFFGPRVAAFIRYKKELTSHQQERNRSQPQQTIQQRSIIDAPLQLKLLLYSTFEYTYYASIYPLWFIPEHVYFEKIRCATLILYVIANLLVLLSLQILSNHFLKFVSHTHFFGYWRLLSPLEETEEQQTNITAWSSNKKPYSKGSIVTYEGKTYKAMGEHNYGVPGQITDRVLFILFCEKPDRSHVYMTCIQSAITLSQLVLFLSLTIQTTVVDMVKNTMFIRSKPHFELLSWESCIIMLLFNFYICHLCVWVRRETLRFLLFLAQTTAPSIQGTRVNTNNIPVRSTSTMLNTSGMNVRSTTT